MKKVVSICIVICLLIAAYFPIATVFAISGEEEETEFFEVSEEEAVIGDTLELTINLSEIEYDNFTFTLEANVDVESIELDKTAEEKEVSTEYAEEDSGIIIQIDKTTIDLETIVLYYTISNELNVGDTIEFTATVVNNETEETTSTTENTVTNTTTNTVTNTVTSEEELSITVEVKIVKETENSSQENNKEQSQDTNTLTDASSEYSMTNNETSSNSQKTTEEATSSTASTMSSSSSTTTTVTYNGSDNNYLEELSIDGYEFTKSFSKENTTYFVTVDEDTEKLTVNAEAEDDDATVCIYGNDDLSKDTNKILINVTAENGNVRTYRIIVTKS